MPGTDPTADLLAALNKALQEGRISPEEYGKRAKVISAAKAQREEDRRRCKEIFDKFDADHSGGLDANEFGTLVATLGSNMSKAETEAAFKSLDTDGGGTVDFEEFYTWWSTPELHGAKPSKLSTLRMTVTTQHLKEQSAAAARKLNEALAANSAKRGEEDTQTINVQVSVGEFTTGSGIKLSYENNEAVAAELAKEFGAAENDVILSVALAAVPGKEAFDLGQLSGKVKDLLSMQEEIKFKAIKNDVKTIGETVVFRINVVVDGKEKIIADTVSTLTENLIKSASVSLEFNEKLGTPFMKELQARLSMQLKLAVGGGATVMGLLKGGGGGGRKSLKRSLGKKDEPALQAMLTSRLREASVKIRTDTVQEAIGLVVGSPAPFNNFHQLRPLFASLLGELPWGEMPDTVLDSYKLATENLLGLHSIVVSANKAVLRLEGSHLDLVKLLPSVDVIKAAVAAEAGSDAEGSDKAPADTEAVDGGAVRWLFAPPYGLAAGAKAEYTTWNQITRTTIESGVNKGLKFVAEPTSQSEEKQVLEVVASREASSNSAVVEFDANPAEGTLIQVSVRMQVSKNATIDSESHFIVNKREYKLKDLNLQKDGAWWNVPLGAPYAFDASDTDEVWCEFDTGSELVNGVKIDGFYAHFLDKKLPPPEAGVPKSEAIGADVVRPICKGGHPMVWARLPRGSYSCDICSMSFPASNFHWQCRPCDGDYCNPCYDKNGKKGEAAGAASDSD